MSAPEPPLVGSCGLCRGCLAGGGCWWPPWRGCHVDVPVVPACPALPLRGSWNLENTRTPRPWLVTDLHGACGTPSPGVGTLGEMRSVLALGASALGDRRPRSPTVTRGYRSPCSVGPAWQTGRHALLLSDRQGPVRPLRVVCFSFPEDSWQGHTPRCPGPPQDGAWDRGHRKARNGRVKWRRLRRRAGCGRRGFWPRAPRGAALSGARGFGQQLCPHCHLLPPWCSCTVVGVGRPRCSHLHWVVCECAQV